MQTETQAETSAQAEQTDWEDPAPKKEKGARRKEMARLLESMHGQIARLQSELPEIVRRIASEGRVENKSERPAGVQAQLDALRAEIQKRDTALATQTREKHVRAAVQGIPWFDPEDAVRDLLPRVIERDGQFFVPGTERIGSQELKRDLPLDEAVKQLAKSKAYWVKADVRPGTGASGANAPIGGAPGKIKYAELQRDPALMARMQAEHPELVNRAFEKWKEKQTRKFE